MSSDFDRPDPDSLLAVANKEEARAANKGRLRIFFGMAPGVGKTYAMLKAAAKLKEDGHDTVIGVVETHGRAETQALLEGLPLIPRKKIEYKGTPFEEMDLDAILARKPEYVLVDELAHTNVPGSRHTKRYQDVLSLIDAGIHVLSTLNVQHVGSRADVVKSITGTTVFETVPDSVLDDAEIELVDLPPDALLRRLSEGKVYLGDRAERAAQNFFKKGNLTALREMALRLTAERVDQDLSDYMRENNVAGPWKSSERLMVAVGASPTSPQLIRWTRRTAYNLGAPWIAVYVETSHQLSEEDQKLLTENLSIVRELGGEIVTTSDVDVTRALLRVARQRNVTQIVVGKPVLGYFRTIFSDPSPVNRLVRESGDIDVYIVNGGKGKGPDLTHLLKSSFYSDPRQYGYALAMVALTTGVGFLVNPFLGYWALGLIMLMAVPIQSLFTGRGPIFLTATLNALAWDYFFIPPRFTFYVTRSEDILLLAVYFLVALVTGTLTQRTRSRQRAFQDRERRAVAMYAFTRDLMKATSLDSVLKKVIASVEKLFDAKIAVFLALKDGTLSPEPHALSSWLPSEKERGVAVVCFQTRKMSGWSTETLSKSEALYLPLLTPNGIVGVLAYKPNANSISLEQKSLLETLVYQAALSLERELLLEAAASSKVIEESERLHKSLLNSISHELRTPIAAIKGASSQLMDDKMAADPVIRKSLLGEVSLGLDRLNRLVANLLDMSRLESGHLKARLEWCDLHDILNAVVNGLKWRSSDHPFSLKVAPKLPLAFVDSVLLEQALKNLVHNALFHTKAGTEIELAAGVERGRLSLKVTDRGPGIPPEVLPHVFEKFYRAPEAPAGGTGLGLSIARGFVEAQGGEVKVANNEGPGVTFTILLPLKAVPEIPREAQDG